MGLSGKGFFKNSFTLRFSIFNFLHLNYVYAVMVCTCVCGDWRATAGVLHMTIVFEMVCYWPDQPVNTSDPTVSTSLALRLQMCAVPDFFKMGFVRSWYLHSKYFIMNSLPSPLLGLASQSL